MGGRPEALVLKLCYRTSRDAGFCPGDIPGFVGELCHNKRAEAAGRYTASSY